MIPATNKESSAGGLLSFRDRRLSVLGAVLVLALIALNIYDVVYHFLSERALSTHQLSEALLVTTITGLVVFILLRYRRRLGRANHELHQALAEAERALAQAEATGRELERFREQNRDVFASLRQAMDDQFDRWRFSPEEKRAARLIIQGLTFREIAARLDKSEKTIRNQSLFIYEKSGMTGRNDLAAFFLLDILDIDE